MRNAQTAPGQNFLGVLVIFSVVFAIAVIEFVAFWVFYFVVVTVAANQPRFFNFLLSRHYSIFYKTQQP